MPCRLRLFCAALILLTLTVAPTGAGAQVKAGTPLLRSVPGTALPLLRGATRLAATPPAAAVDVTVALHPRHPALLAYTAAHSFGHPLSPAQLRALFAPSASEKARVVSYLRANGLALRSSGMLALTFRGTAAAAGRAFHVGLASYRSATGHVFRAADGAVRMPASVAPLVASVTGLDTATRLHSSTRRTSRLVPHTTVPSPCAAATNGRNFYGGGGYMPGDLAQAYGSDTLVASGGDGTGQRVALVEFTRYKADDVTSYKSCFGIDTPVARHDIGGGNGSLGGAIEAQLDIDVALTGAPNLDGIDVYEAPNNVAEILPMLEAIRNAGTIKVVSDSWGICEAYLPPSFLKAESDQFELSAAAGISFFSATGDFGSSDCMGSNSNDTRLVTDDPSSQPFVTGVGGTRLPPSLDDSLSTAWSAGGGGVSAIWPAPAYQSGFSDTSVDDGGKCGNTAGGACRQVPDVALDAYPGTNRLPAGYMIYCTVATAGCPPSGYPGWFPVGGTSAAAPLMAAITADANTYSLAHGGSEMGFANPFLYSDPAMFTDITAGSNSQNGSGLYQAGAGYDPATGLGSPKAVTVANDLAAFTPAAVSPSGTTLTISSPLTAKTIRYGQQLTLSGTLTGGPTDTPIAGRRVFIELIQGRSLYLYHAQTDVNGDWSITLSKAFRRNTAWRAVFPGSDTEAGATRSGHAVDVIPSLGARAPTTASRGALFTVTGSSTPNMHGAEVALQERRSTGGRWHTIASVAVGRRGTFSRRISFSTSGAAYVRWHYAGGKTRSWMSATSRVRKVAIH